MNSAIPNDLQFGENICDDDCESFKSALSTALDLSNSFLSYSRSVPIENILFQNSEFVTESSTTDEHEDSKDDESHNSNHSIELKGVPTVILGHKTISHKEPETVNSITFNQDKDCIGFATSLGYQIQSLDYNTYDEQTYSVHRVEVEGGILLLRMLHRSSLIAVVKTKTPRMLSLLHSKQGKVIKELPFTSAIRRMEMNKECLVVLTSDAMLHVFVYRNESIDFVQNIGILDQNESARMITAEGATTPGAFFDLSTHVVSGISYLVTKSCNCIGMVTVHSISSNEDGPPKMNELLSFKAHNHTLSRIVLGLSSNISINDALMATCSLQGTIIRVFHLLTGQKLFELHRGSSSCTIFSLAFNQDNSSLIAYGSKGTNHIFSLSEVNKIGADVDSKNTMISNILNRVMIRQKVGDGENIVKSYAKIRVKGEKPLLMSVLSVHRDNENEIVTICMPSGKIFQFAVERHGKYKPILASNLLLQKNTT